MRIIRVSLLVFLALNVSGKASPFLRRFASPRNVRSIVMHEGTAWLATSGGIGRYERHRDKLKLYTDLSQFPDLDITTAVKGGDGAIWFGSHRGDLIRLDPERETFVSYNALRAASWYINTMHAYDDYLFIGSPSGLSVFSIEKRSVVSNVTRFGDLSSPEIIRIRSRGKQLALLTPSGIAYTTITDVATVNFSDPNLWKTIDVTGVRDIQRRADGSLAGVGFVIDSLDGREYRIGTPDNWLREDGEQVFQFVQPPLEGTVNCITKTGTDTYLIGTEGQHFWYWKRPSTPVRRTIEGPTTSNISSMVFDRRGALWYIGRDAAQGLGTYDGDTWTSFTHNDPDEFGFFIASRPGSDNRVTAAPNGDIFLATLSHGVKWYDVSGKSWTMFIDPGFTNPVSSPDNTLRSIAPVSSGAWWTLVSSVCKDSSGFVWAANALSRDGHILHAANAAMTRWRSFNVQQDGLFDPGLPTATGPLTATRAEGTNHIYLTFSNSLGKSSGGLTILSYSGNPLSGSVDVRRTRKQISIGAMAVEDSASVWVAAEDGVYRVSGNDPDALESIDTLPRGKYYRAIAVTTKPDRLAATSPAELCFLARELRDRYTRSGTIASLAELAYHTEVLVGFDGDLYSYKPVDKALFTRLSRCDSIDYDILTEVRDSLRDSLSNLTNSGLLGTAIRAIAVEDDPRYVWVGSSAGLFKLDRGSAELAESEENEDNGALRAFPNPARLSSLRTSRSYRVRFTNVNRGSRLIVYTVSGQRIRELPIRHMPETQNYYFEWDGRNDHGSMVEPGTYVYYAFLEGKKGAVGKVLLKP